MNSSELKQSGYILIPDFVISRSKFFWIQFMKSLIIITLPNVNNKFWTHKLFSVEHYINRVNIRLLYVLTLKLCVEKLLLKFCSTFIYLYRGCQITSPPPRFYLSKKILFHQREFHTSWGTCPRKLPETAGGGSNLTPTVIRYSSVQEFLGLQLVLSRSVSIVFFLQKVSAIPIFQFSLTGTATNTRGHKALLWLCTLVNTPVL